MSARTWIIPLLALSAFCLIGPPVQAQDANRSFAMGMAYWPPLGAGTPDSVVRRDLDHLLQNIEVVHVQIPWCPEMDLSQAQWMSSVAREAGKELAISIDWMVDSRRGVRCAETNPWTFAESPVAMSFEQSVVRFAREYEPEYMLLGVEVDYYAIFAPDDFREFLTVYQRTRNQVKQITDRIQVGVSLQYEHMRRISGESGTFAQDMLTAVQGISDFIGIAAYPFIAGVRPEGVNREYFKLVSELSVPLIFSETAWPGFRTGLPGISATQDAYVTHLLQAANDLGAGLVMWAGMRDVDHRTINAGGPIWATVVGLWDGNGEAKRALGIWQAWLARSKMAQVRERPQR